MNPPDLQKSLLILEKARSSKRKYFFFCLIGCLVGVCLYLVPYNPDRLGYVHLRTIIVEYMGLGIAAICGVLALFFGTCFFTKIWENICDWNVKKIHDRLASTGQDRRSDAEET